MHLDTFLSTLAVVFTEPQISRLIDLGFKIVEFGGTVVTLAGVIVLIWRQSLNKKEITAKIDENTAVNVEQIKISNGHNEKIAAMSEQIANTKPVVVQVVTDPAIPQKVIVENDSTHPVPVHAEPQPATP